MVQHMFQSPRSGRLESNLWLVTGEGKTKVNRFQSPRSGKFESNLKKVKRLRKPKLFQSPRSGKFESNNKALELWENGGYVSIP